MKKFNIVIIIIILALIYFFPSFYSQFIETNNQLVDSSVLNLDDAHKPSENLVIKGNSKELIYYNQNDLRWAEEIYGNNDSISLYGCGPTALAMLVSSLTEHKINPLEMAVWAKDNGFYVNRSGSTHNIIPDGLKSYGISVSPLKTYSLEALVQELASGNLVVVLMNKGTFTAQGHFIILTGITLDGKLSIADPNNIDHTLELWDPELILKEAKYGANAGGPFWSVST